jgi:hypothetical protein
LLAGVQLLHGLTHSLHGEVEVGFSERVVATKQLDGLFDGHALALGRAAVVVDDEVVGDAVVVKLGKCVQ